MSIGGQTHFWQLTREGVATFASAIRIAPRFVLRQLNKPAVAIDAAVDERIALHQADTAAAHPILETTRIEIHKRCEFIRGIAN